MVEFGNLLNYTAMGVGNHDFDDSVEGFVPFAEQVEDCEKCLFCQIQVNFPLLGANINSSLPSFTETNHYNKVKQVTGRHHKWLRTNQPTSQINQPLYKRWRNIPSSPLFWMHKNFVEAKLN